MITVANIIKDFENSGSGYSQVNNLFFTFAENGHHNHAVFVVVLDKILSSPARIYRGVKLSENEGVIQFDKLAKLSGISKGSVSALLDKLIDLGLYEKRTVSKMVIVRKVWIDAYKKQQTAEPKNAPVNIDANIPAKEKKEVWQTETEEEHKALAAKLNPPLPGQDLESNKNETSLNAATKISAVQEVIKQIGRGLSDKENAAVDKLFWLAKKRLKDKATKQSGVPAKISDQEVINSMANLIKYSSPYLWAYSDEDKRTYFSLPFTHFVSDFARQVPLTKSNYNVIDSIFKYWDKNETRYENIFRVAKIANPDTDDTYLIGKIKDYVFDAFRLKELENPLAEEKDVPLLERQHKFLFNKIKNLKK